MADGKKKEAMLALRRWEQQKRLGEDCQNHLNKLEDGSSLDLEPVTCYIRLR